MNRLSRYSFGVSNSNAQTTDSAPKKRTIAVAANFLENLEAAAGIAPYKFEASEEATKYFAENLEKLEIRVDVLDNGNARNKAIATIKGSDKPYNLRVYGTDKVAVAEQDITKPDDLKKLIFGYCKTNGEYVSADGVHSAIYVNVSALM